MLLILEVKLFKEKTHHHHHHIIHAYIKQIELYKHIIYALKIL